MKLAVPRSPNADLTFVIEGGGLVVYYDANVLRTIEYEETYPDADGPAFVVWQRAAKHEDFTGDEIVTKTVKYDVRNVEAIDYSPVNPEVHPKQLLALLRKKWYNRAPKNMDRPAVIELVRNRVAQYLRPPQPGNN